MKQSILGMLVSLAVSGSGNAWLDDTSGPPAVQGKGCRIYASSYETLTTSTPVTFSSTIKGTCEFNAATLKTTCINNYSDTFGNVTTSTWVTAFKSIADAIDEVAVVPPRRRSMHTDTTMTLKGAKTSHILVNTYDGQNRLTGESAPGASVTYKSWDASGRPTSATQVTGGVTSTLAYTYDDATRTQTIVTTSSIANGTCTSVFDANGNNLSNVCTTPGGTTTAKTTIGATKQICQ